MKKGILILTLVLTLVLVSGCGNKETKQQNYEKIMEEYAVDYHEKFAHKGVDQFVVTKEALANVVARNEATYDLDKLKNCENDSKVTLTYDGEAKKITNKKFEMNCKK